MDVNAFLYEVNAIH